MVTSTASGTRTGTSGGVWETLARAGFAVSGLIHVILGGVIINIGLGGNGEADSSSALSQLREAPLGGVILWASAGALLALGLWQLFDALRSGLDATDRAKAGGKFVLYASLAVTSASIAMGSNGSSQDQQATSLSQTLMSAPAGAVLVGALGLGIVAGGGYHVYKGATTKFLDDLKRLPSGGAGKGVKVLGSVGYIAKGLALAAVGVLFVVASATNSPDQAKGIDGGVESLLGFPAGGLLVVLIGAGFAAYGLYSFARARDGEISG